jgi:arabinose-5-phosphate isomerase
LHGDFGLLQQHDALIAIGFGGETHEVLEVMRYAKRLGVYIIGITGKPESTLGQISNVCLNGSVRIEACPLNLAPTSSSTLALALGDAIAVALMKAREFKEADFANLHPGGSLGRKLARVRDYMRPASQVPMLDTKSTFKQTIEAVTKGTFGIASVVEGQSKLIGVISDGDLRRALVKHEQNAFSVTAGDIMSQPRKIISEMALIEDAVRSMEEFKITSMFVLDATSKLVGIIRMHDIMTAKLI